MPSDNHSRDVERWAQEQLQQDRELRRRDLQISELRAQVQALHAELDDREKRLDTALSISAEVKPGKISPRFRRKQEATAVICASDWHVEEVVDPKTISGRNKYNPEIAEKRARTFWQNANRLVELARSGVAVNDAVLWLGGDLISGYIHEELREGNAMSPTEACLFVKRLMVEGIDFLMDQAKLRKLIVVCNYGNHGRTDPKKKIGTGAKNSYEWLTYQVLRDELRSDSRITFQIADGIHVYTDIYDKRVRWHHGDEMRYMGGVGGISIPLRRAVDSWNTDIRSDLTVVGHWHQFVDFGFAVVNGSLIGWNPYAISVKARFEPPRQAFFLMDKERGKTLVAPIWVE